MLRRPGRRALYIRLAWKTPLFLVPALIVSEVLSSALGGYRVYLTIASVLLAMIVSFVHSWEPNDHLKELAAFIQSDHVPQTVKNRSDHIKKIRQQWDKKRSDSNYVSHPIATHPSPPRFEPDDPEMLSYLQKHGLCMIFSPAPTFRRVQNSIPISSPV